MTIHVHSVSFISIHGNGWDDSRNEGVDASAIQRKSQGFLREELPLLWPFILLLSSEAVEAMTAARAAS